MTTLDPSEINFFKKAHNAHARDKMIVCEEDQILSQVNVDEILALNDRLQAFYEKVGDEKMLALIDRMTAVMNGFADLIDMVKSKKISLDMAEREITEKIQEVTEIVDIMRLMGMG